MDSLLHQRRSSSAGRQAAKVHAPRLCEGITPLSALTSFVDHHSHLDPGDVRVESGDCEGCRVPNADHGRDPPVCNFHSFPLQRLLLFSRFLSSNRINPAHRLRPDLLKKAYVTNAEVMFSDHPEFKMFAENLDVYKHGVLEIKGRFKLGWFAPMCYLTNYSCSRIHLMFQVDDDCA